MSIMNNIRDRHRDDSGTLDKESDIDTAVDDLVEAAAGKNTPSAKFIHIVKNMLGLKDNDVTADDRKVLSKLMNCSKILKPKIDQRKRK